MNLLTCLHPKVIYNKSLHEYVTVACGKCDYCKQHYLYQWQQRLKFHAQRSRYAIFFTLTYAPAVRPMVKYENGRFYSQDIIREYTIGKNRNVIRKVENDNFNFKYDYDVCEFGYLRKKDVQMFMKRLRSLIHYEHLKLNSYFNEKVSYFIAGEYGPKGLAPHFHGLLFFESPVTSKNINTFLHKAWKLGFINWSPAQHKSCEYVAKYIACSSDYPSIYENSHLKPFFLCSRKPIIGSYFFDEKTISAMLVNASHKTCCSDIGRTKLVDVFMPRSLEMRIYPKIKGFSTLSPANRVVFMRQACGWFTTKRQRYDFASFKEWCFAKVENEKPYEIIDVSNSGKFKNNITEFGMMLNDLGYFLKDIDGRYSSLYNLYKDINNICRNSLIYGYSVNEYINKIVQHYENKKSDRLKEYFVWQDDFCKRNDKKYLVNVDMVFKHRVFSHNYWVNPSDGDHIVLSELGINPYSLNFANGIPDDKVWNIVDPFDAVSEKYHFAIMREIKNRSLKTRRKNDQNIFI